MREAQKRFFTKLDEIQQCHDYLTKLSYQVEVQLDKRKATHDFFDEVVEWQKQYKDARSYLPRFDHIEKGKLNFC
jgi:hypothetical protein